MGEIFDKDENLGNPSFIRKEENLKKQSTLKDKQGASKGSIRKYVQVLNGLGISGSQSIMNSKETLQTSTSKQTLKKQSTLPANEKHDNQGALKRQSTIP